MVLAGKLREMGDLASNLRVPVLRATIFVLLAYLLSGCSWVTSFVITNKTSSVLEVNYQFGRMRTGTSGCFDDWRPVPSVGPISDLQNQRAEWRQLNRDEYSCDVKKLRVRFPLKPNMAVSVGAEVNYFEHSLGYSNHLGIDSLRLSGNSGSIAYEGLQVIRGFRKVDQTLYVLGYE